MNTELSEKLYDEFPELFRGRHKPMTESLMCFGFACGDGWFELIQTLSKDIMSLSTEAGIEPPEVVQVKEKFGGLRYYIHGGTREINGRIHQAEEASLSICELCGDPGRQRGGGYIQTLCDEHHAMRKSGVFA